MTHFKKTSIFLLLVLTLLAIPAGCDDTLNLEGMTEQEIQALFVGEWEEIARGNSLFPELGSSGDVIEFRSDGTVHGTLPGGDLYAIPGGSDQVSIYRVDAWLLYINGGEETSGGHIFRHKFTGKNKFRLDHVHGLRNQSGATPDFLIYKRIK